MQPGDNPEDLHIVDAELEPAETDGIAPDDDAAAEPTQASPPPPTDPRELRIRFLEAQLVEKETTLHAYIKAHKKAEAEFEAYKGRLERDQAKQLLAAKGKIVKRMLDVDENLERTLQAGGRGGSVESLLEGVQLVHKMFLERLTDLGLERVDPTGQPFDPATMEALGMVPVSDARQDNHVVMTMRAGFRLGDHEIRPALVQVGRYMN
ncbi:MAG: molecular chaperone GrpE [Myxococcota bacterium]|jgi:molecular chaperone GrpE